MGGGGGGFLTSRGTSNVLTRTTAILAATFFATSLLLSILAGWDRKPRSILQDTRAGRASLAAGQSGRYRAACTGRGARPAETGRAGGTAGATVK